MKLFGIFPSNDFSDAAHRLYAAIVEQSRQPGFYLNCGVPDTPDGRFDMIMIHAYLVLDRLKDKSGEASRLSQEVFDILFADMDQNLREMGTGDMGVGKKIKAMAEAFYGRIEAYASGLKGEASLEDALARNPYRQANPDEAEIVALAAYMRRQAKQLEKAALEDLLAGTLVFGPAPTPAPTLDDQ
ncbi:MAG: ubiquinol-cytochrome C chaperone family protein [Rhodospirillales bacterium]|nr:ubiquinol-cytochrome C chaperone family protein [Alphaproteobacteria bacterium]MBL6947737.1 ubiquinol-cytochrome C chaperone family protein [Rhodospirillales bacterium]